MTSKTITDRLAKLEQRLQHNGTGRRKTLDDFYKEVAAGTSGIESHYPNDSKHHHSPPPAHNRAKLI